MSLEAMSHCWGPDFPADSDLGVAPSTIRLVALSVADVVNDLHGNEFYGSATNIAVKVGVGRGTVGIAMKHLVQSGVLSILERRTGGTVRYRWNLSGRPNTPLSGRPSSPVGLPQHELNTTQPESQSALSDALEQPGEELKLSAVTDAKKEVNKRAKKIVDGYWSWYQERHGTKPINNFQAYRGVVAKALAAGHEDLRVKQALVRMHDAGVPLSNESLDRELRSTTRAGGQVQTSRWPTPDTTEGEAGL